jgi:hypothetical protein
MRPLFAAIPLTRLIALISLTTALSAQTARTGKAPSSAIAPSSGVNPSSAIAPSPGGLAALKTLTIHLGDLHDPPASSTTARITANPFTWFEVIDERPDTTRIGVHANLPMRSHEFDRQLVFGQPAALEIAAWLNRHCQHPAGHDTAVIILRYLWLSDSDPYTAKPDNYQSGNNPIRTNHTHIRLKAEIYALHDHRYLPLLRIDTLQPTRKVIYSMLRSTYLGWEQDLAAMLHETVDNAAAQYVTRAGNGRRITWQDIRTFNQTRFDIPILDSSTLVRGVYTGFDEFRNNTPAIRDFDVMEQNGSLALYLKNGDGTSAYTHKAWGFCNGHDIFLMRDGLLHPIRKDGNSFYFYGIDVTASNSSSPPIAFNGYPEQHCLYIIDLDTGQFY